MHWDTFLRLWRWGNAVSAVGVLQFVACLALAMLLYAGGNPLDRRATGYSFFENYLSDLGRSVAWSGAPNAPAAALFSVSLVLLALATIPFFLFLPLHAPDRALGLWVAAGFGILSAFGLAGVGLTPYDQHLGAHLTALLWWIMPFLIAVVLHFLMLMGSRQCSPLFPLLSLALAILIALYIIRTLVYGLPPQSPDDADSLRKSIVLQKCVLFASLGWYLVLSVRMVCTIHVELPKPRSRLEKAAAGYLRRLQG